MEDPGRVLDEAPRLVARLQRHARANDGRARVDEIDLIALRIARRERRPVGERQQRPAGERRHRRGRLRDRRRDRGLDAAAPAGAVHGPAPATPPVAVQVVVPPPVPVGLGTGRRRRRRRRSGQRLVDPRVVPGVRRHRRPRCCRRRSSRATGPARRACTRRGRPRRPPTNMTNENPTRTDSLRILRLAYLVRTIVQCPGLRLPGHLFPRYAKHPPCRGSGPAILDGCGVGGARRGHQQGAGVVVDPLSPPRGEEARVRVCAPRATSPRPEPGSNAATHPRAPRANCPPSTARRRSPRRTRGCPRRRSR